VDWPDTAQIPAPLEICISRHRPHLRNKTMETLPRNSISISQPGSSSFLTRLEGSRVDEPDSTADADEEAVVEESILIW